MTKRQPSVFRGMYPASLALNSISVAERLAELQLQHAVLSQQLRELHHESATDQQTAPSYHKNVKWHSLINEVARLRTEMESLKTFSASTVAAEVVFDNLLEI